MTADDRTSFSAGQVCGVRTAACVARLAAIELVGGSRWWNRRRHRLMASALVACAEEMELAADEGAEAAAPRPEAVRPAARGRGPLLLAIAIVGALTPAAGALAQDGACRPEFRAGSQVWYAVESRPRVARYSDSACRATAGAGAGVRLMMKGSQDVIFCDLDLPVPQAMRAEMDEAERQASTELPSRRRGRAGTWETLVRKYSRELVCAPGFARTSDASAEPPSVSCQKRMTARELCPQPGSTYADGACYSMACPDGTDDLDLPSAGKLAGCSRCPVGRLDVKETLAWQDPSAPASERHGPVTTILCRATAADPCPTSGSSTSRLPGPGAAGVQVGESP